MNEESEVEDIANAEGFWYLTDIAAFKAYVETELTGSETLAAD